MKHPNIDKLYKYRPINKSTLRMLKNKKVWVSTIDGFNDPFEFNFHIKNDKDLSGAIEIATNELGDTLKDIPDKVIEDHLISNIELSEAIKNRIEIDINMDRNKERFSKYGIYCLSELKDSILMWSHYADDHKGICIEFERSPGSILGSDIIRKVEYKPSAPIFTYAQFKEMDPKVSARSVILTKFEHWKYEEEWRIIVEEGNEEAPLPGRITKIFFGLKSTKEDREVIYNLTKDIEGIEYEIMIKHEHDYKLESKEHNVAHSNQNGL